LRKNITTIAALAEKSANRQPIIDALNQPGFRLQSDGHMLEARDYSDAHLLAYANNDSFRNCPHC